MNKYILNLLSLIVLTVFFLFWGGVDGVRAQYSCSGSVTSTFTTYTCPMFPMPHCVPTVNVVGGACSPAPGLSSCSVDNQCGRCAQVSQTCVASSSGCVILPVAGGGTPCGGNSTFYNGGCSCNVPVPTNGPTPTSPPPTATPPVGCGTCNTSNCSTACSGQPCGICSNGGGTCSIGTRNCTPPPSPTPGCAGGCTPWVPTKSCGDQCSPTQRFYERTCCGVPQSGCFEAAECGGGNPTPEPPSCIPGSCWCLSAPGAACSYSRIGNESCDPAGPEGQACCIEDSPPGCSNPPPTPVPPPPGVIQGCRVIEPGSQQSNFNAAATQVVTVDGAPSGPFDARLYCYSSTVLMPGGGTHSVSTSVPVGYGVGYTLCYNNINCHSYANIVSGNSVSVSNDSVMSGSGNPFYYADLWWHYCPDRGPTGLTATDSVQSITLNWSNPASVNWTSINIFRDGVLITNPSLPANATSFVDTAATCGSSHSYAIHLVQGAGAGICRTVPATINGFCVNYASHFVARGSNVSAAGGQVGTTLPTSEFLSRTETVANDSGMVYGNGFFGNLVQANANPSGWLLNIGSSWGPLVNKQENSYFGMRERVLARVLPYNISAQDVTSQGMWDGMVSAAKSFGNTINVGGQQMVVMRRTGALNMAANINIGTEKILILVDGDVSLAGTVQRSGVVGTFVIMSGGNITVNSSVGHADTTHQNISAAGYAPHLTGVFFAQGVFDTGSNGAADRQLRIDGAVIGMGGVNMRRRNAGPNPTEYVDYKAEMIYDLNLVGLRKKTFQELLAP